MKKRRILMILTTLVGIGLVAVAVLGPATGLALFTEIKSRATLQKTSDRYTLLSGVAKLSSGEVDPVVQQLVLQPGERTGWHSHPGPVVVLVKSGTFTLYNAERYGCERRVINQGESFVDKGFGHVHDGRNEGTTPVELWAVYLLPKGGPLRTNAENPGVCG